MTQLEKIRSMSAEELARWLIEEVEQQNFTAQICEEKYCKAWSELEDGTPCTDCTWEDCIAAGVRFLESEVSENDG